MIILVTLVALLGVPIAGLTARQFQLNYRIYHNARFDYSISYPADILIPQGEAVNGDGQKFLSRDSRTEMLVYGSHNDGIGLLSPGSKLAGSSIKRRCCEKESSRPSGLNMTKETNKSLIQ